MNQRPLTFSAVFILGLAISTSAADPSIPPDGVAYQPVQQSGGDWEFIPMGKCANGWVVVPRNGRSECVEIRTMDQQTQDLFQLQTHPTLENKEPTYYVNYNDPENFPFVYGQDASSPWVRVTRCPPDMPPVPAPWPMTGTFCSGSDKRFSQASQPRIYEESGNKFKPLRAVKTCTNGTEPIVVDWPFEGDMMCSPPKQPSAAIKNDTMVITQDTPKPAAPATQEETPKKPETASDPEQPEAVEKEPGWLEGGVSLYEQSPGKWANCTFNPFKWFSDDCKAPKKSKEDVTVAAGEGKKKGRGHTLSNRGNYQPPEPSDWNGKGLQDARDSRKDFSTPAATTAWADTPRPDCRGGESFWIDGRWRCRTVSKRQRQRKIETETLGAIKVAAKSSDTCREGFLYLSTGVCIRDSDLFRATGLARVPYRGVKECRKGEKPVKSNEPKPNTMICGLDKTSGTKRTSAFSQGGDDAH